MLKQLKNNRRGVVFVIVLMIIIVLMVLTLSVMAINISQIVSSEEELRRVQAQSLAIGALYYMLANRVSGSPGNSLNFSEVLGSYTFNVEVIIDEGDTSGPSSTHPMNITVTVNPT